MNTRTIAASLRKLVVWAVVMGAILSAFSSCAQLSTVVRLFVPEKEVKLTSEELQRLVYSSHVLTVIDDKPELEGALLALRELHRENPQASPASLVRPVRWTLDEYHKESSSRTLPVMWRDEILGRYFLKFSEVPETDPELPERRNVILNLLNVLLAQQDVSDLLEQKDNLFYVENQRLLVIARGPGERQALVESCTQRATSDPNFAVAMDGLMHPEVGVTHDASPQDILAKNEVLCQSPTMKELMHLSSSSKDDSVEVTIDKLKDLFAHEVTDANEALERYQALDRDIKQAEEDIVRYPDSAIRLAEKIQRYAEEQEGQWKQTVVSSVAAKKLSELTFPKNNGLARKMDIMADTLGLLGAAASGKKIDAAFNLVCAGMKFSTLFMDEGPPPEETILESVKLVGKMISDLSEQMEDRFNRVDRSLVTTLRVLQRMSRDMHLVRADLLEAQASINRLERKLGSYLNDGFGRVLVKHINGDLGFEARTGEPMSWKWYRATDGPENAFYTWAVHNAKDELASPQPANADLEDIHLLSQLENQPLERNLNYIKEFLRHRIRVSSLPKEKVASLGDWYAGANAYLRLAAENPQHFRRINPNRLDEVIKAGTELENFFRTITFVKNGSDTRVNRDLYNAVLSYYEEKLNAFNTAVDEAEEAFVLPQEFWRDSLIRWRVGAETSDDSYVYPSRIPNDIIGIGAGTYHSLAIRADGTVVAWGANYAGQCKVPPGLSDVVSVSGGASFSVALKADGTIVAWGTDRGGRCDVPAHEGITKICAGPQHTLALGKDGRVIAWGAAWRGACDVPKEAETHVIDIAAAGCEQSDTPEISLALKADGNVVSWGQAQLRKGLSKIVAISAGYGRAVAVKDDGTIFGWKVSEFYTDLDASAIDGVRRVASVALGLNFTLALKTDGTVEVIDGSLEVTPDTGSFIAIAAEKDNALALRDDGTVVALDGSFNRQLCKHVLNEFHRDLNDNLDQLTGAKNLLQSVVTLGLPDSLNQNDVLRGLLFGSESLIDRDGARILYEAARDRPETRWQSQRSTLQGIPEKRLKAFRDRLYERLADLEETDTPEIPRMVAYTLLQLRLLRAAY